MRIAQSHEDEVVTTERGFRKSTTVMGALTGLGGDIFIVDDPQKTQDAQSEIRRNSLNHWFSHTLLSRLDNKETGAIIVVMQRVHIEDLSGYLINSSPDWTVLSLPAIAEVEENIPVGDGIYHFREVGAVLHPARETLATLENMRITLGSEVFSGQYQQSPVPTGGAMIKRVWLRYFVTPPERTGGATVIQSWDTAAKGGAHNCWSVCTTWLLRDKNYYLLDTTRGRYDYPRLRSTAVALADRYDPDVILIEDASTGTALAADLKQSHRLAVKLIPVEHDKAARLYVHQAKFEAGLVHFPKDASWLRGLEDAAVSVPARKDG